MSTKLQRVDKWYAAQFGVRPDEVLLTLDASGIEGDTRFNGSRDDYTAAAKVALVAAFGECK